MPEKSVDVIIPSYKPDMRFISLLKRLVKQSVKPGKIIIINTDKSEWEALGFGGIISESSELLKACVIRHIKNLNLTTEEAEISVFHCQMRMRLYV